MKYRTRNKMKPIHIFLITLGSVLCAAALTLIGLGVFGILNAEIQTDETLKLAEAMLNGEDIPQEDLAAYEQAGDDLEGEDLQEAEDFIVEMEDMYTGYDKAVTTPRPSGSKKPAASRQPSPKPSGPTPSPTIKKGTVLGMLVFDSLNGRKVPVVQGADARQLGRGAGHHDRTSMPGKVGNCLIFGHRNTVFRGFGGLKTGDHIQIKVPGVTYTYRISSMTIVEPNDPLMFRVYDHPVLTLVTCYPFHYTGHAPKRYVVVCDLIS